MRRPAACMRYIVIEVQVVVVQQGSYASAPLVRFSGNGHESAQSPSEATHDS